MSMLADAPMAWPDWEVSVASPRVALLSMGWDGVRWANTREAKRHLASTCEGPLCAVWETRVYTVPPPIVRRDLGLGTRVRS